MSAMRISTSAALEDRDGPIRLPAHDVEGSETPDCQHAAVGVVRGLGDGDSLLSLGDALGKVAELRQAPGEPGARVHRGQPSHPEVFPLEIALKRRDGALEEVRRPPVVTERVMSLAETQVRHDAEAEVPESGSDRQVPLTDLDRAG